MLTRTLLVVALLGAAVPAHAHYIWLERDGAAARAFFGEWSEDLREKTGGSLDNIKTPRAFHADRAQSLPIERRADHLEIGKTGSGDLRLVEDGLAPRDDKRNGGKTKSLYHAREGRNETQAALELELVPAAANGNAFTLLLRGAPVAKAEVKVFGPPHWEKPFRTDEQGKVTIETPWAGRYVLEVVHLEPRAGEFAGLPFDRLRHVSTLSFTVPQGIAWTGK